MRGGRSTVRFLFHFDVRAASGAYLGVPRGYNSGFFPWPAIWELVPTVGERKKERTAKRKGTIPRWESLKGSFAPEGMNEGTSASRCRALRLKRPLQGIAFLFREGGLKVDRCGRR